MDKNKIFIDKAEKLYGKKYDYSLVNYIGSSDKIIIICPKHGKFIKSPNLHLQGQGCPKCIFDINNNKKYSNTENFITKSNKIHKNKYTYLKSEYKHNKEKLIITCQNHGDFLQTPHEHLLGRGCKYCSQESMRKKFSRTNNDFIKISKNVHNGYYDYSKVEYINTNSKVIITCPKHGDFLQTPKIHIKGSGCSICNQSKGENMVMKFLNENNIKFEIQKTFDNLKGISKKLKFDFFIPNRNICIEFDGRQHFEPFSNIEKSILKFTQTKINDERKNKFCIDNNIKLIRIHFKDLNNISIILKKELGI